MTTNPIQPTKQAGKHVLLIDDDEALRRLFGGYLEKAGFQIIYATDGDDGREIARRLQPDIILLDLGLPGMDGYQLSTLLKKEEMTKKIPIIILSNVDMSKEAEAFLKQTGVEDYIHKSIQADELVARVSKVLEQHTPQT